MAWLKRSLRFTILSAILAIALTIGLGTNLSAQVITQSRPTTSSSLSGKIPIKWNFTPPRGRGLPVNRQGGATRGIQSCFQGNGELTALVPPSQVGETADAYPTLLWYMPKSSASEVELVLRDAKEQTIYSTKYTLAKSAEGLVVGSPGIMSLPLPAFANLSPLEIGENYYWMLRLICPSNPSDVSDNPYDVVVGGGIVRVNTAPNLDQSIQQALPQDRVALYANAGLWYETAATLVELRRDRPNDKDIEQAWNKLLNSVGLDAAFRRQLR